MKKNTPHHPKMDDLARRLKITVSYAAGIMECLWHFASDFCPSGELKYNHAQIAAKVYWDGDADDLVAAMVDAKWLYASEGRIFIHDWPDHCEDSVHMKLARARQFFWNGSIPKVKRLPKEERGDAELFYKTFTAVNVRAHAVCTESKSGETNTDSVRIKNKHGSVPRPLPSLSQGHSLSQALEEPDADPPNPIPRTAPEQDEQPDLQFETFQELCEQGGMNAGAQDYRLAKQFHWPKLDFTQKLAAVKGLRDRLDIPDDPVWNGLPKNYLDGQKWQRKVRDPTATGRKTAASKMGDW